MGRNFSGSPKGSLNWYLYEWRWAVRIALLGLVLFVGWYIYRLKVEADEAKNPPQPFDIYRNPSVYQPLNQNQFNSDKNMMDMYPQSTDPSRYPGQYIPINSPSSNKKN